MNTIIETKVFTSKAAKVWSADEYEEFLLYIAHNPDAGDLVPGAGGVRKVRWKSQHSGKRGGVRIVYFNSCKAETWLLLMYVKSERETIPAHELKKVKEAIHDN